MQPEVDELRAFHAAVILLCSKINSSPAQLAKATSLNAYDSRLDPAGAAIIATLVSSGVLGALTRLHLHSNQIGNQGLIVFSDALGNGSMGALTHLGLSDNQIGDAGMDAFSRAISNESMGALTYLNLASNQIGNAYGRLLPRNRQQVDGGAQGAPSVGK